MPLAKPPAELPEDLKDNVDKLSQLVRTLMVSKQIPWRVMAKMGEDGYVTMGDLADRWNTADEARASSPADLDFNPPAHGITADEGKFIAMAANVFSKPA